MLGWFYQMGLFVAVFAVPCLLFWLSALLAEELRDFFESTTIAMVVHVLITGLFAFGVVSITNSMITPEQLSAYGIVIRLGVMVIVTAWMFGATGCLYDDQAPNRRLGARGLKRYR